ncbi:MAG TPA: M20/M25/M40 family metallo-hydrolase [Solirubrobacteraceae bacterium]|jgi:tripeptide aminopeptidase|nr:M20/M25/M40 family metallo-hydrolase [Solirubrobacteraceae bacterium]
MRPASDVERRRLNETFARLCAIPSPFGSERACAEYVARELRRMGLDVEEDGVAAEVGAECGNLLARIPGRGERTILLCAHLDTVPEEGVIEPVLVDGGWVSAGDTILGADNKAAVAMLLEIARRTAVEGSPVGLELLFTVCEEVGLVGAKAFDVKTLRSDWGYVFDHASPIGEIIVASPTYYRVEADFRGTPAHAGIRPEDGRSAIEAAARAIGAMRLGRIDEETTTNIAAIRGGQSGGTNIVAGRCTIVGEVRSLDPAKAEAMVGELIGHIHDAANTPACACDVDVTSQRLFDGYRHAANAPAVLAAEEALRACGYTPTRRPTGGGSDANAFESNGLHCTNLANGTERNHEPTERVSVAALEGMLDVAYALLDACSA